MNRGEIVRGGRLSRLVSRSGAVRCSDAGPLMEHCETRTLMDAVFWDGGAGTASWHDAANWNRNGADAVPVNGDDVTINVAANPTVIFNTGALTLTSLTTNENLTVSGGTLGVTGAADVNAALLISGGTISGGTWDVAGGQMRGTSSGGTVNNAVITGGDILLDTTSARMRFAGTSRFVAARMTANNATVEFAPGYTLHDLVVAEGATAGTRVVQGAVGGNGTLTISPTGVIRLAAGTGAGLNISNSNPMTLINNGLVSAEAAGRTLNFNNSTVTNNGTMQAIAGTLELGPTNWTNTSVLSATNAALTLAGAWSNTGTITSNASTTTLGGAFTTAGLGAFNRTGGTVALTGAMDNTGATFSFTAATGSWSLSGGSVTGGTLNFNAGNRLGSTSNGGRLTDVDVNGELIMDSTSARMLIAGATRFDVVRLTANNANVDFAAGYTLHDLVVSEGATPGARAIQGAVGANGTLTISPTGVIRLAAGSVSNLTISNSNTLTLINNGLITAEAAGRTLSLNNSFITNNGTMQAMAGALDISPTSWTNTATLSATGATLTLGGDWSSTGTTTVTNSTLNLGGTFELDEIGTINRTGGTVNVTGSADNTGNTFALNAASGSWTMLGGTITGGTINISGGERLLCTSSGGNLVDLQLNGDLILDTTSSRIRIGGSTRFGAARMQGNAANVDFAPGYTLHDLVVAEGATTGARSVQGASGGNGTLTIGATGVIRLAAGSGGGLSISNSNTLTLINNGLISAEAAGRTLTINNTGFTNNGTMLATAGILNVAPTTWTNAGSITATDARIDLGGAWSNTGTISVTNSILNLGGTFTTIGFGSVARTGGTVNLTGDMNNASSTFTFNAGTGSWNLVAGTITGGTINHGAVDRLAYTSSGGTLTDVQLNGEIVLDVTSARVRIAGTTRFPIARLTANAANIDFTPGYTLHDVVVAEGATTGARSVQGAVGANGTLTISPTGVIRLAAGSGGNLTISDSNTLTLINNGLISAEAAGRTLTVNNSLLNNNATMRSLAGTLDVRATTTVNAGTFSATDARLDVGGAWTNTGAIAINNSTFNVGGTFTTAGFGSMTRTGGAVNLTGTMNNASSTFTFNAGTGSWDFVSGTVTGGVLNFTGGNRLALTSSGGDLIDVQVNGDLIGDVTSARVRISGSTRFTALRLAANAASVQFAPGYVLNDLVVAEGATTGGRSIQGAVGGNGTLTVGATGVIRLAAGSGGGLTIFDSNVLTLINNGLISGEAAGRTLNIGATSLTNNGTIQALAGSTTITSTTFTNYAKGVLTGGTFNAFGAGVLTLPAGAVVLTNNATIGVGNAGNFAAVLTVSTNNGTIQTGGGGTFTITPDGGTLVNNGTVRLAPTNTLNVAGNYTQADAATMVVQIQGENAGDIGRMTVTGTATLNGNITVQAVNGYQASCVNLPFLNAASVIGEFDSRTLPTPIDDHQALIVYIGPEVRFAVSPPSDFNMDGVLNSQDLFDFLTAFFSEDDLADFNDDGVINSQDFFDFITDFFEGCE